MTCFGKGLRYSSSSVLGLSKYFVKFGAHIPELPWKQQVMSC